MKRKSILIAAACVAGLTGAAGVFGPAWLEAQDSSRDRGSSQGQGQSGRGGPGGSSSGRPEGSSRDSSRDSSRGGIGRTSSGSSSGRDRTPVPNGGQPSRSSPPGTSGSGWSGSRPGTPPGTPGGAPAPIPGAPAAVPSAVAPAAVPAVPEMATHSDSGRGQSPALHGSAFIPPTPAFDPAYQVLLDRNVFVKGPRQKVVHAAPPVTAPPPVANIVAAPPPVVRPETWTALRGVAVEDNQVVVVVEDLNTKSWTWLTKGDAVARGQITEADETGITYVGPDGTVRIGVQHLLDGRPAPAITEAVAVAPPAPPPAAPGAPPAAAPGVPVAAPPAPDGSTAATPPTTGPAVAGSPTTAPAGAATGEMSLEERMRLRRLREGG